MAKPVTTDGIAKDGRNGRTKQHTTIEHWLEGEAATERQRQAPVGTHLAHTCLVIKLGEVVGKICIFCIEASSMSGEVPTVLAIVIETSAIAVKMFVFKRHLHCRFRTKFVAIVHIIPSQAHLQVEVTQGEIKGQELCLELIITDVIVKVTIRVHIHIVATEGVAERRTRKATGMDCNLASSHHSLTQSQGDIGIDRDGRLQRNVEP